MIRWYDYIAAFVVADVLLTVFFTIPIYGGIIAYIMYEFGWIRYCLYRKNMET